MKSKFRLKNWISKEIISENWFYKKLFKKKSFQSIDLFNLINWLVDSIPGRYHEVGRAMATLMSDEVSNRKVK